MQYTQKQACISYAVIIACITFFIFRPTFGSSFFFGLSYSVNQNQTSIKPKHSLKSQNIIIIKREYELLREEINLIRNSRKKLKQNYKKYYNLNKKAALAYDNIPQYEKNFIEKE